MRKKQISLDIGAPNASSTASNTVRQTLSQNPTTGTHKWIRMKTHLKNIGFEDHQVVKDASQYFLRSGSLHRGHSWVSSA